MIVLGVFLFIAVALGVSISFKNYVSDIGSFVPNESATENQGKVVSTPGIAEPEKNCEDCGLWCTKGECLTEINGAWKKHYIDSGADPNEKILDRCKFDEKLGIGFLKISFGECKKN